MWDRLLTDCHIATMDPAVPGAFGAIEDGAIGIQDGRIVRVGRRIDLAGYRARTVEPLGGAWVTPGLIDCHTHLVFGGNRSAEFEQRLNGASYEEIARAGGQPLMYKTGHSLIKAKMAELQAPFAGEMSGHIFYADRWYGFDDALYVAVRLLGIVARMDGKLSAVRHALPQVVNTPELRFDCDDERKFTVIEEVAARLNASGARVNSIDGVRVQTDDGWWLLRASNTQAVLVARAEAHDEAGLERLKAVLVEQLLASGLEAPDFSGENAGH